MDFRWISSRFQVDFKWISGGLQVDFRWISSGFQVDFKWISSGFQAVPGQEYDLNGLYGSGEWRSSEEQQRTDSGGKSWCRTGSVHSLDCYDKRRRRNFNVPVIKWPGQYRNLHVGVPGYHHNHNHNHRHHHGDDAEISTLVFLDIDRQK